MKKSLNLSAGFVCVFLATLCQGGLLNPTTPPTAGTMKPLDQVEPRTPITSVPCTISSSGSYYLTKNLTSTGTAITISADDVTLDLCGFTLTGPGSGTNYGIYMNGRKNIEIRNGTIKSFGTDGIYDSSSSGGNQRILRVQVIGNKRYGIYLHGSTNQIKDCVISGNGSSYAGFVYGINTAAGCAITGNTVYENGMAATGNVSGIYTGSGCKITDNVVYGNGVSAGGVVYGINCDSGSTITDNSVFSNGSYATNTVYGIYALNSSNTISGNTVHGNGIFSSGGLGSGIYTMDAGSIMNNIVRSNGGPGITGTNFCQIIQNTITGNSGAGISVGENCTISKNTAGTNTSTGIVAGNNANINGNTVASNSADGITAGDHVTITDNTVTSNYTSGITCTGGTIAKNTVSLNNTSATADKGGIVVANHSQIKENTLEGNTKNNIYVTGYRSSIEGNVMSGSDYGINFGSTGNVYLNNRAASNGVNYNPAGNTDGGGNISF
jgi:hypothetical protein